MEHVIHCPKCAYEFELSTVMREQLAAEVGSALRTQFEGKLRKMADAAEARLRQKDAELTAERQKVAAVAAHEAELLKKQRELDERSQRMALDLERRLAEETARIRDQVARAADERWSREADERVRAKAEELALAQRKLALAADKEAELLQRQRELEERERERTLELERRMAEEGKRIREQATRAAEERAQRERDEQSLKDEEHRQQIAGLKKTVEDLQRKISQGSQQVQGEAQEVALRDLLTRAFLADHVVDVAKGVCGADVLQHVVEDGRACGTLVWESKRTRTWSDEWLAKLKDDLRASGAACAVLVSQALPADVKHFALRDGVWVCAWPYATALGAALRAGLVEVAQARCFAERRGEKMQMLYDYLTSTEFRHRVSGVVEALHDMHADLDREKRAMSSLWKRRERQLERARANLTAFYGDLQGIAGRQLGDVPLLALPEPADALPSAERPEDDDLDVDSERAPRPSLVALLFTLVPDDGTAIGNGTLRERFVESALVEHNVHATNLDYERCKATLLADGRLRKGKGKGGSVARVLDAAAE